MDLAWSREAAGGDNSLGGWKMTKPDALPSLAEAIETAVARHADVHREAGASHDRAAYYNTEPRALWLGQVSEAATALAGTRVCSAGP
jgi:ribosome modulation factor